MSGPWFIVGGSILAVAAGVFLLILLYLALGAGWSLVRTQRSRQFAELAAKKHREGDIRGAVDLYVKADHNWALNAWDGGRESWNKDLDLLSGIASGLTRALAREPGTAYSDLNATVREMRGMLNERRNFGVDGRKMLPDVMIRWKASVERLRVSRARLREACLMQKVTRL